MFVRLTLHPAAVPVPTVIVPRPLPTVAHHAALPAGAGLTQLVLVVYLIESAKYASSAVTMFRRSDFIEEMYAFSFVLANFGIAIEARMPMITTTINSSMSVKPLRFIWTTSYGSSCYVHHAGSHRGKPHAARRPSRKSLRSNGLGVMRGPYRQGACGFVQLSRQMHEGRRDHPPPFLFRFQRQARRLTGTSARLPCSPAPTRSTRC